MLQAFEASACPMSSIYIVIQFENHESNQSNGIMAICLQ